MAVINKVGINFGVPISFWFSVFYFFFLNTSAMKFLGCMVFLLSVWLIRQRIHLPWRRHRRFRFDPWITKISWGGNGNPLQYSFLRNPMEIGFPRSWTQLSNWHIHIYIFSFLRNLHTVFITIAFKVIFEPLCSEWHQEQTHLAFHNGLNDKKHLPWRKIRGALGWGVPGDPLPRDPPGYNDILVNLPRASKRALWIFIPSEITPVPGVQLVSPCYFKAKRTIIRRQSYF